MSTVREAWTDERLDDLAKRMDDGFDRVDRDIREVRADVRSGFEAISSRFDALQRTLLQVGGGVIVTILASTVASHL